MGGEVVIIFVLRGRVLRLLLLVVSNYARKFGIYSNEVSQTLFSERRVFTSGENFRLLSSGRSY